MSGICRVRYDVLLHEGLHDVAVAGATGGGTGVLAMAIHMILLWMGA